MNDANARLTLTFMAVLVLLMVAEIALCRYMCSLSTEDSMAFARRIADIATRIIPFR